MVKIRQAHEAEFPLLRRELKEKTIDLKPGLVWVAVDETDAMIAVLPLRLCWQAEPLHLLSSTNKMTSSRACLMLYLAVEEYIKSPQNIGPMWLFCITRSAAVKAWSKRLGWRRIYVNAACFIKHLAASLEE